MSFDIDISSNDIRDLSNRDQIAAFFARLGYDTNKRIEQTPGNLGILADGIVRPIKKVELIASQDGYLEVYLFELSSVTVTHTKALARSFRNRSGNYLLVLTSDYERLDFVLVEKYIPDDSKPSSPFIQKQVAVRPRTLTVGRKNPLKIDKRVLRRFTYTESDPFLQYEKLKAAYSIADWSEENFNNRALFSDYYLTNRLQERDEWKEDPLQAYKKLSEIYLQASSKFANVKKSEIRSGLIEPVLKALGFYFFNGQSKSTEIADADYVLFKSSLDKTPLVEMLVYPWGRSLDSKDDKRDSETPDINPGAVVVSRLQSSDAQWAIVTNGKIWRLYSKKTHAKASNYYEIDLDEVLAHGGAEGSDIAESFRYFWLLFRMKAFKLEKVECDGREQELSPLDFYLLESEDYAKKLGERLKERTFEKVFPHISKGFIHYIKQVEGKDADLSDDRLKIIFQGTLTLLYRLLFLLYAESRDLLPVREIRGYYEASLKKIKEEIAEKAKDIEDEAEGKINKHYKDSEYAIYERLSKLFTVIDKGDSSLNVPFYNGGLFITNPPNEDTFAESENSRFLRDFKVPDCFMANAIDLLARDIDDKLCSLVMIDYKSLGVRQLGSIYEGLLEFKLRIAPEKMAVIKGKKTEEVIPYKDAISKKLKIKTEGRGKDAKEKVLPKGAVYLENDKRERKATGSYYTPDHIVKYIIEHAVGSVLEEKFEALTPKIREAELKHQNFFRKQESLKKQGLKSEPNEKANLIGRELVDEIFNIKVLDPAMGSGHFLVEAVDFITDKMLHYLDRFRWNPVYAYLDEMRRNIIDEMEKAEVSIDTSRLTDVNLLKRHVLKRCIYGVDKNPMAVELAKVSLWLDCFTLGAPLSFLDHHMKCGNSLIGVTVDEVQKAIEGGHEGKGATISLFGSMFEGLKNATQAMQHVSRLSDATSAQLRESKTEFHKADYLLLPFKRILDIYTSQWFRNKPNVKSNRKRKIKKETNAVIDFLSSGKATEYLNAKNTKESAQALMKLTSLEKETFEKAIYDTVENCFFHWELEFPEVFFDKHNRRLEGLGFDAVVGNPPYDVLAEKELDISIIGDVNYYTSLSTFEPAIMGKLNLAKLFICKGRDLLNHYGNLAYIVPMTLLGDKITYGVRSLLLDKMSLSNIEVFPQKDDPQKRIFFEAKLSTVIFIANRYPRVASKCISRIHSSNLIETNSPSIAFNTSDIHNFDNLNLTIPSCSKMDWELAQRITSNSNIVRLGIYCKAFQGEINETTDGKRGFISYDPKDGLQILRGLNVCLYTIREASQGRPMFLRVNKYLKSKVNSEKAQHHKDRRVLWQEASAQNNFRRIIAASIKPGEFCNHAINYIPMCQSSIDKDLILAILNSKIIDWYFRLGSTNNAVSHYQIMNLPVPKLEDSILKYINDFEQELKKEEWNKIRTILIKQCDIPGILPEKVRSLLEKMSGLIQNIESARKLNKRAERSHLDPKSQPIQDVIDSVLYKCYGLTEDEGRYIDERLKEML